MEAATGSEKPRFVEGPLHCNIGDVDFSLLTISVGIYHHGILDAQVFVRELAPSNETKLLALTRNGFLTAVGEFARLRLAKSPD